MDSNNKTALIQTDKHMDIGIYIPNRSKGRVKNLGGLLNHLTDIHSHFNQHGSNAAVNGHKSHDLQKSTKHFGKCICFVQKCYRGHICFLYSPGSVPAVLAHRTRFWTNPLKKRFNSAYLKSKLSISRKIPIRRNFFLLTTSHHDI